MLEYSEKAKKIWKKIFHFFDITEIQFFWKDHKNLPVVLTLNVKTFYFSNFVTFSKLLKFNVENFVKFCSLLNILELYIVKILNVTSKMWKKRHDFSKNWTVNHAGNHGLIYFHRLRIQSKVTWAEGPLRY